MTQASLTRLGGAAQELYRLVFPEARLHPQGPVPTLEQLIEHMELDVFRQCYVYREKGHHVLTGEGPVLWPRTVLTEGRLGLQTLVELGTLC